MDTAKGEQDWEWAAYGIDDQVSSEGIPQEFICAYSGKLMVDPVIWTASDLAYEREVIAREIEVNGKDPITKEPITKKNLRSNTFLKKALNDYRNISK